MNRTLTALAAILAGCVPVVAMASEADAGSAWPMGIFGSLASAAILGAIKSWSDVNVLKAENARISKTVDEAAQASHVTEGLTRLEKRLDRIETILSNRT